MKGSEKQIKWAQEIINQANKAWDDLKSGVKPEAQEKFAEMKKDFFARMESDSAEVIISYRDYFPTDSEMLKSNFAFFQKSKIQ